MRLFFIILSIMSCAAVYGQEQNSIRERFNDGLAEYSSRNKTIECDFIHIKHLVKLTGDVKMYGKFYYNNNGAMALRYSRPEGDAIIIKEGNFSIITAGKAATAQGGSNPMLKQITQMMKACMTGDVSQLGKGWETNYSYEKGKYIIELVPQDKRSKKYISGITLIFDGKDMSLEKLLMRETSGNYSLYEFSGKIFNRETDPSKFRIQ